MELLPDAFADPRIQLLFTITGDRSVFSAGLDDQLSAAGVPVIPWDQALAVPLDLAVAASHHGDLQALDCPVLVLPHGPGYSRRTEMPLLEQSSGGTRSKHRMVYALPHRGYRVTLQPGMESCITGDPCFDALRRSTVHRAHYRRQLGVTDDQKLVMVTSTWGPASLFGAEPTLFESVLRALPSDEFAVAAVLHPNVWIGHGQWQLRLWLRHALDAGLRLIPYERGWRATLVAADYVLGDHGSVTFYAAACGKPVWLRTHGTHEMVLDVPNGTLGSLAPPFLPDANLAARLHGPNPLISGQVADRLRRQAFEFEDEALNRTRALAYELLELQEPHTKAEPQAAYLPYIDWRTPTAHFVSLTQNTEADHPITLVNRVPASLGPPDLDDYLLVASENEPTVALLQAADRIVLASDNNESAEAAARRLPSALRRHPGASAVAARETNQITLVRFRSGQLLRVRGHGDALFPPSLAAAVASVHEPAGDRGLVEAGSNRWRVVISRVSEPEHAQLNTGSPTLD
jgi:hypothetical protein